MKKHLSLLMAVLFAGSMMATNVLSTNFLQGIGTWTISDVTLDGVTYVWSQSSQYGMKATAFYQSSGHDAESWLISPTFDLTNASNINLYFEHALNFGAATNLSVKIKSSDTDWTNLLVAWPQGNSWNSITAAIPLESYAGKSGVQIAFVYVSNTSLTPTWEIMNVTVSAEIAGGTEEQLPDTLICMQAAHLAINGNTDEVIVKGYVTEIVDPWSGLYNNVSFWMSDATDGGHTFEAYRVTCASDEDAPAVGDLVWVKGNLQVYNSIPETTQGGSFGILEDNTPYVAPINLGQKSITEFLALKNTRDTCILSGVVSGIVLNSTDGLPHQYGVFYLQDGDESLYIYRLITPDGQVGQFRSMNIAEGDSLTIKAVYSVSNNAVRAKDAVYVSHNKTIDIVVSVANSNLVNKIEQSAWFQLSGYSDDAPYYWVTFVPENTQTMDGTFDFSQMYPEYTRCYSYEKQQYINFVSGQITVSTDENEITTATGRMKGDDGNYYNITIQYAPTYYYVIGSFNNWERNEAYKLEVNPFATDEYRIRLQLNEGDQLCVMACRSTLRGYYPNNTDSYAVDAAHAGDVVLYFSTTAKDEWSEFFTGGYFFIEPIQPQTIEVNITSDLTCIDSLASEGWWQISGYSEDRTQFISLTTTHLVPDTLRVADLWYDYAYVANDAMAENVVKIHFTSGQIIVYIDQFGAVTVNGQMVGEDYNIYNIHLEYANPQPNTVVNLTMDNGELMDYRTSHNGYYMHGNTCIGTDTIWMALFIYTDDLSGNYTHQDCWFNYTYIYTQNSRFYAYEASIEVVANEDGSYTVTAHLLCYNNTLYNVTMTIPVPTETGLDDIIKVQKATKILRDGQVLILRGDKTFTITGQEVK